MEQASKHKTRIHRDKGVMSPADGVNQLSVSDIDNIIDYAEAMDHSHRKSRAQKKRRINGSYDLTDSLIGLTSHGIQYLYQHYKVPKGITTHYTFKCEGVTRLPKKGMREFAAIINERLNYELIYMPIEYVLILDNKE